MGRVLAGPLGVPLLYASMLWYSWPTLSKLRRAELRAKSTKALGHARRQSVAHSRRLLEGELRVAIQRLGAGGGQPPASAGGRCRVSLTGERLELQAGDRQPLQLELLAGTYPQLRGDGKELLIEGTLHGDAGSDGGAEGEQPPTTTATPSATEAATAAMDLAMEFALNIDARGDDADAADASRLRARLTLSLMPGAGAPPQAEQGRSRLGALLTSRRRGSTSAGPSLQDWFVAVSRAVPSPELSLADASTQLRRMRLAPILMVYELRCFYWELETPADLTFSSHSKSSLPALMCA
jgi:hypothetical protein